MLPTLILEGSSQGSCTQICLVWVPLFRAKKQCHATSMDKQTIVELMSPLNIASMRSLGTVKPERPDLTSFVDGAQNNILPLLMNDPH